MRVALLVFVSAFFSIASGLKECSSIPSFTFQYADNTGRVQGQCRPSKHPGAFYTDELTPFAKEEQLTDDTEWHCWAPYERVATSTDAEAEAMAKTNGFAGACTFAAYESTTTPEEVPLCTEFLDHNPPDCHPGPESYWGACVTNTSEKWKCIPKNETDLVAGVAKGDCNFFSVRDDREQNWYHDVCRFEIDKPFKCPTVPTYTAKDASTCSSGSEKGEEVQSFRSACFSLAKRTPWSCRSEAAQESTSCTWTHLNGKKPMMKLKRIFFGDRFYDGLCLFPGSPGYDQAADWSAQPPAKDQESGIGGGWIFVLVLFVLGAVGGPLLYLQRAKGARQQPLIGDGGAGSEMSVPGDATETKAAPQGRRIDFNPSDRLGIVLEKGENGRVIRVHPDSQACQAGVKAGWVILKVGRADGMAEQFSQERLRVLCGDKVRYHLIFKESRPRQTTV